MYEIVRNAQSTCNIFVTSEIDAVDSSSIASSQDLICGCVGAPRSRSLVIRVTRER